MSRIAELINHVKIYNLCNYCDHFKCNECSVDNVNCKEEIEKQIVAEIRADVIEEVVSKIDKLTVYYAGDKDGNAITPKMLVREDVIEIFEEIKEQK